jgi:hypothetical protein
MSFMSFNFARYCEVAIWLLTLVYQMSRAASESSSRYLGLRFSSPETSSSPTSMLSSRQDQAAIPSSDDGDPQSNRSGKCARWPFGKTSRAYGVGIAAPPSASSATTDSFLNFFLPLPPPSPP